MSYRELLVGCGSRRNKIFRIPGHEDWTNVTTLDLVREHRPDVVWNLRDHRPLPFEDNTFDELHFYEVLEHIGAQGDFQTFFHQFEDYWRILKPDGLLCATVPRWDSKWAWGDPGHTRVINLGTLIFLSQTEYSKQVGVTPMSDYRPWYDADFELMQSSEASEKFVFLLRAIKPSRKGL